MAEKMKVTVLKTFGLGGKVYTPGEREVPTEKVERLTARKLIAVGASTSESGAAEGDEGLERFTVTELKDMAKEREIEGYSTMKKAELIEALEAK